MKLGNSTRKDKKKLREENKQLAISTYDSDCDFETSFSLISMCSLSVKRSARALLSSSKKRKCVVKLLTTCHVDSLEAKRKFPMLIKWKAISKRP